MESLRSVLDDRTWASRWRGHLLRLDDLRDKVGTTAWNTALAHADNDDRAVIQLLLKGELA
ncbi:hypothetical protein ACFW9N_39065 [Streptomyces sp. NPDC059496]|uniref:hypothetical protein n=1 Tax=Streptomyces sp. NPDC059496 TaxID=3346851 RepID=UPI00367A0D54